MDLQQIRLLNLLREVRLLRFRTRFAYTFLPVFEDTHRAHGDLRSFLRGSKVDRSELLQQFPFHLSQNCSHNTLALHEYT